MPAVLDRPQLKTKNRLRRVEKPKVIETVVLHNTSWETYENLLREQSENPSVRFSYNDGELEIMVESYKHGNYSRYLEYIILELADIFEIDFVPAGSATFKKEEKSKGFESDGSFYIKNAEKVRGIEKIDLSKDPPPELVIEVDIMHSSLSKFPIFAGLGVEEIWRFDGEEVRFHRLENQSYKEINESICFKGVSSKTVTELFFASQEMKRINWIKLIHEKIREEK